MAKDPATYFRATNGVLVDAICISDFKANVAIVFVGIMMGPRGRCAINFRLISRSRW